MRGEATPVRSKRHPSAEETLVESTCKDRAAPRASILRPQDVPGHSFKENLGHHPFVFVIQKMAMKDGHAPDYGVGEVHDDVDGAAVGNIHCVQPHWLGNWPVVFGVRQKMDLMDVHGMQFP